MSLMRSYSRKHLFGIDSRADTLQRMVVLSEIDRAVLELCQHA